jgi:tetratricopeptide (TPR) repeat protein
VILGTLAVLLAVTALTPAEKRIEAARKAIAKDPSQHSAYNDLAMALARRARETSDPAWYDQAARALEDSLRLAPGNYEARKAQVWVLLGKHDFAAAAAHARALNKAMPDDVMVYGFLVDAHIELGDYQEAKEAAQWMLDLRPGNVPGLTRAAYLRELHGDLEGAIELMETAWGRIPPSEVEDRSWVLTQLARLRLHAGKPAVAEKLLARALELFPEYHYALGALAEVRSEQGRQAEAAALEEHRCRVAPHPENFYRLGLALDRAGRRAEAARVFSRFERLARAEMDSRDNANRELALYYAGRGGRPAEALRIARREIEQRQDVHTRAAYARALQAAGRHAQARKEIRAALALGACDPEILAHAQAIGVRR